MQLVTLPWVKKKLPHVEERMMKRRLKKLPIYNKKKKKNDTPRAAKYHVVRVEGSNIFLLISQTMKLLQPFEILWQRGHRWTAPLVYPITRHHHLLLTVNINTIHPIRRDVVPLSGHKSVLKSRGGKLIGARHLE